MGKLKDWDETQLFLLIIAGFILFVVFVSVAALTLSTHNKNKNENTFGTNTRSIM